jgi:hypothetical protein
MRPVVPFFVFAAVAACATGGAPRTNLQQPLSSLGTYEFSASIRGQMVTGTLYVRPDTILVGGDCSRSVSDSRFFNVGCSTAPVTTSAESKTQGIGALLRFDRGNPDQGAKWSGNIPVQKRREVCARYETRDGRQVCASKTYETYVELQSTSGPVQMRRVQW